MPDKSPHRHQSKKQGMTIKQKRADKRAKSAAQSDADPIAHIRKRSSGHQSDGL